MAFMITTVDNPYSPVTQFDEWYAFDILKGYGTCAYLARVAQTSPDLSPKENQIEIDTAIEEIIRINGGDFYRKVDIFEQN